VWGEGYGSGCLRARAPLLFALRSGDDGVPLCAMDEAILGIDLGTSGAKAGLYTTDGRLLGIGRSRGYGRVEPWPGWSECDAEVWWSAVRWAIERACAAAEVRPGSIQGVGLSVLFPAVVPLDGKGKALRRAILYNDGRSLEQCAALEAAFPAGEYRRKTGNPVSPGTCAATSILWIKENQPEVYHEARVIGFANTFLAWKLAGVAATDFTHAGLSGLVDIRRPERWDPQLCCTLGVDVEKLPRLLPASTAAGEVTQAASIATGLRKGTPVAVGMGDAGCAGFGAGVMEPRDAAYVAGTTDCVTVPLRVPAVDHRWLAMGHAEVDRWLGIGTMTSTGAAMEWFVDQFYAGTRSDRLRRMAGEAESVDAWGGPLFLPYLQGERTPHWDAHARGVFADVNLGTTRAQLAAAVLCGTALGLRDVVDCLPERPQEIRACGGGLANACWTQLKADALGLPLHVLSEPETGSRGAAMLAAVALGHYRSCVEAARAARKAVSAVVVEPDITHASRVADTLERYRALYARNRELMHRLATHVA
jgi:xylulokinase